MHMMDDMTLGGLARIGFVSELSPTRREAWSGTIGFILEALKAAGGNVVPLEPIWERPTIALNIASKITKRLTGSDPMLNRSHFVARQKGHALERVVRQSRVDAIFAPAGSSLIAKVPAGLPIAYSSDATLRLLLDYYPAFTGLSAAAIKRGIALERQAMERADLLVYPTHWAAESAISDYGIDPARILVQPFGANLKTPPSRESVLAPREPGPLRLLFCGVDWKRKGGDIALETLDILNCNDVPAELTVLGCVPPVKGLPANVHVIPFLDKNIPEQREAFEKIFRTSDILIMPTQAECYGLVFCEAAAYGMVSVASRTGGIPEIIREGETGFVITLEAAAPAYAKAIMTIAGTQGQLEKMKRAARDDFEARLNWTVWGKAVLARIDMLLQ